MEPEKRALPRLPPVELTLPTEPKHLLASWMRTTPISEPERPTRWVWIVLGVTGLFILTAGGGYYSLNRPGQRPAAAQAISPLNAVAKPIPDATEGAAITRAPQLAVGLPQLTSGGSPGELAAAPEAPQSSAPTPVQSPKLAVGLRPMIDQVAPAVPAPPAKAPPPAPPATVPQAKPPRKAAAHGSSPTPSPGQSSSFVKF